MQSQRAQRAPENSKRLIPPWLEALARPVRQRVETIFSQIEALLPHHIHAVTEQGFVLKVMCCLLADSIGYRDR